MNKRHWNWIGLMVVLAFVLSAGSTVSAGYQAAAAPVPALALPASSSWSRGWEPIASGVTTFTHNLGGDPATYAVDLWFRDTDPNGLGVTQFSYGGDITGLGNVGIFWRALTATTIDIVRRPDEAVIDEIYLRIWIPETPDYDSGWVSLNMGETKTLTHSLGGNPDDYSIGFKFQSSAGPLGIHSYAVGGLREGVLVRGAAWQNVTASSIDVMRFADDITTDQVRVTITRPTSRPVWDSDWKNLTAGGLLTLNHNIGGNIKQYVVRFQYKSAANGLNNRGVGIKTVGASKVGAIWQELTTKAISVVRGDGDPFAEQARVRIFVPGTPAFLPLIAKP